MNTWPIRECPVPPGWRIARLVDIVSLINGYPFRSEDFGPTGDIPLIRIRDLLGSEFEAYVSGPVPPDVMVNNGDVLVGMDGDFNVVRWTRGKAALNQRLCMLRPRPGVDIRFVAYALPAVLRVINDLTFSTTVKHLSSTDLLGERIVLPPLDEQRRIADLLDAETARLDKLRSLGKRQTELLHTHFLETVRSETSGTVDGKPTRETGLPWMPKVALDWTLGKVSHHFRTGSGTTPSSNNDQYYGGPHPWVITGDVRNGPIRATQKTITDKAVMENTALKKHKKGSLIVAMYGQGDTKGNVGILEIDAFVNQACCALTPVGRITSQFAYYWFRGHKTGIVQLALGAGQPNLSQELIRLLRLPIPDKKQQEAIVRKLSEAESATSARLSLLEARDRLLLERKHSLITAAVTGQFDVAAGGVRGS